MAVLESEQTVSCFSALWRIPVIFREKNGETEMGRESNGLQGQWVLSEIFNNPSVTTLWL